MEASLQNLISSFQPKLDALEARQNELRGRCEALKAENNALKAQLHQASQTIERLNLDCEFLRISHKLADSPDALIEARRHIATLIRRLDSTIALLKEDPAL